MVGTGAVESEWLDLARNLNVSDSVVSHGLMYGNSLDDLFDICHVGSGALAIFRKKCKKASELKIREYTARGLPFFYSAEEPQIAHEKFCLRIPNDESPVDIQSVLYYYDIVMQTGAYNKMHQFALENFSCLSQLNEVLIKSGLQ